MSSWWITGDGVWQPKIKLSEQVIKTSILLSPMLRGGVVVTESEGLEAIRKQAKENIERLHPTIRCFMNPHEYPVGLDIGLHELRDEMVLQARRTQLEMVP